MDILSELRKVYKQEWWHTVRISDEELDKYHDKLIKQGNIFYLNNTKLVAYIEYWKITEPQLKEVLTDDAWSAYNNDVTNGDIAFVANIWIHPDYRGDNSVDRELKRMFLDRTKGCKKFVWTRNKKNKAVKLFTHKRR